MDSDIVVTHEIEKENVKQVYSDDTINSYVTDEVEKGVNDVDVAEVAVDKDKDSTADSNVIITDEISENGLYDVDEEVIVFKKYYR